MKKKRMRKAFKRIRTSNPHFSPGFLKPPVFSVGDCHNHVESRTKQGKKSRRLRRACSLTSCFRMDYVRNGFLKGKKNKSGNRGLAAVDIHPMFNQTREILFPFQKPLRLRIHPKTGCQGRDFFPVGVPRLLSSDSNFRSP